ncbi:MAG: hypothetical protein PHQ65_04215 [Bacteroidales bacterium]|nr:hypothetical protein [Bacteroidales bacterium]MDD3664446.1 hypothetical protein [Bacteroidales bacterium]
MKIFRLFLCILGLFTTAVMGQSHQETIPINGFEFTKAAESAWKPATVPGTIHTDLLNLRLIPDPFIGQHEAAVQWIGNQTWIYRTTFNADKLADFKHVEIKFGGLDTHADVLIDGRIVLQTHNMFRAYSLPLTEPQRKGDHQLEVVFHPAQIHDSLAAMRYPTRLPDNRTFSRKAGYHYGWDWGPKLVTCGITAPVTLEGWNIFKLKSVQVRTISATNENAILQAEVEVFANEPREIEIKGTVAETGTTVEKKAKLNPGNNTLVLPFQIQDPNLWWPRGHGRQALYHLNLLIDNQPVTKPHPFGIRKVELVQKPDDHGTSFAFKINGKLIYAKGANYIPQDNFITRPGYSQYHRLLTDAAHQGFNMLRVWGGGIYERDCFYNLCDSLGLMVWQDFMFACYFVPATPEMVNEISMEADYQIRRLRPHPSVVMWCGNNEIDEAWHNWGYQKLYGYTASDTATVWGDYQKIFNQLIPRLLEKLDPDRPYWPSSPQYGWGRAESLAHGDMHYWGVWWGNQPFEVYRQKTGRFMSEYGFQSYPHPATISQWAGDRENLNSENPLIKAHQKHPTGAATIETYLAREFAIPQDFDHYVYLSQVLQAKGMAVAIETHRIDAPRCMGTLFWQLNDCWPVTSWSATDYYQRPKAFFHHLKRLFAPVLIAAHLQSDTLSVRAVTDSADLDKLSATLTLADYQGNKLMTKAFELSLKRNEGKTLATIPLKQLLQNREVDTTNMFVLIGLNDKEGRMLSHCRTLLCSPKNFATSSIALTHTLQKTGDNSFTLTLSATKPAFDVFISTEKDPEASFSDNYTDVLPGVPVEITIKSKLTLEELQSTLATRCWNQQDETQKRQ